MRSRSISPGRSSRRPRPISAPSAFEPRQKALLDEMVEKRGRLGRKNGKGFYDYPEDGPEGPVAGPRRNAAGEADPDRIDVTELKHACSSSRRWKRRAVSRRACITDVREADVGSILGFGFAPFTGGTLSYIDMIGTKASSTMPSSSSESHRPRFAPSKLLSSTGRKKARILLRSFLRRACARRRERSPSAGQIDAHRRPGAALVSSTSKGWHSWITITARIRRPACR